MTLDELLTIVVIALVNRFVHGRVPTAVNYGVEMTTQYLLNNKNGISHVISVNFTLKTVKNRNYAIFRRPSWTPSLKFLCCQLSKYQMSFTFIFT